MSKYAHNPAPTLQAERFIQWCAENISEWIDPYVSCARHYGTKNKWWKRNVIWRTHHKGLSTGHWVVCTKKQWEAARDATKQDQS